MDRMDEAQALDALTQVLSELAERPHDVTLYAQHIRISRLIEGMEQPAFEAMTAFMAAPEEVWLGLLKATEASVDIETAEGVKELLDFYVRAETDYLCTPLILSRSRVHKPIMYQPFPSFRNMFNLSSTDMPTTQAEKSSHLS
jgi:hypothetical protein